MTTTPDDGSDYYVDVLGMTPEQAAVRRRKPDLIPVTEEEGDRMLDETEDA